MQFFKRFSPQMPTPDDALAGRQQAMDVPAHHYVNGASLTGPWPDGTKTAVFALGCFWGAEKDFWQTPGVVSTAVGYVGGYTRRRSSSLTTRPRFRTRSC
jgi:peptide-methionine (S)-S-oxide reductase